MRRALCTMAISFFLALSGCSRDGIPLLGLDNSGNFITRFASDRQFHDELSKASSQVNESTSIALRTSPQDQSGKLRTVAVGLGFNVTLGLGPALSIGASPRIRFIFSNSRAPIIP